MPYNAIKIFLVCLILLVVGTLLFSILNESNFSINFISKSIKVSDKKYNQYINFLDSSVNKIPNKQTSLKIYGKIPSNDQSRYKRFQTLSKQDNQILIFGCEWEDDNPSVVSIYVDKKLFQQKHADNASKELSKSIGYCIAHSTNSVSESSPTYINDLTEVKNYFDSNSNENTFIQF